MSLTKKELLSRAIEIAIEAHKGQVDKFRQTPYIEHPFRVMASGKTMDEKIIGILHDVVEDTEWTFDDLRHEGFPEDIIMVIDCLTRRETDSYDEYIERVRQNPKAIPVKISDLVHNMDLTRLNELGETELERLKKYFKAYKRLTEN